mgnify:FL=1
MSKEVISVSIDKETKINSTKLFNKLGLDLSTAINIFLKQCILRGEFPFDIDYSNELLDAAKEAIEISKDPNIAGYKDMDELKKALEN